MKNLTYFIFALLLGIEVSAQAPQSFRYQAVARDNSGNVLASQNVSFRISILNGSVSGTVTYSETYTGLSTNAFGLVELEIGKGTPVSGTFSSIGWGSNTYFVKIEMDPAGGVTYQDLSTSQLLSVPYALYAEEIPKLNVSLTGDTLYLSKNNWVIVPGASNANAQETDSGLIEDIDGNVYKTVEINSRVWMAENLSVTHYNDGTPIANVTDNEEWMYFPSGAYCWYDNDSVSNAATYGALYNGYVLTNSKNVCPEGWHVAYEGDVFSLINSENLDIVGGMLKETGIDHWQSPNSTVDNNKFGFSALPGGWRSGEVQSGEFWGIGQFGSFWQNNGGLPNLIGYFSVYNNSTELSNRLAELPNSNSGRSIRCVKDY